MLKWEERGLIYWSKYYYALFNDKTDLIYMEQNHFFTDGTFFSLTGPFFYSRYKKNVTRVYKFNNCIMSIQVNMLFLLKRQFFFYGTEQIFNDGTFFSLTGPFFLLTGLAVQK